MSSNTAIYIYVAVSIIAVATLAGILIKCNSESYIDTTHSKDMCLCSMMGDKLCANRDDLKASYLKGNNEYQQFVKPPNFWASTDFNKY